MPRTPPRPPAPDEDLEVLPERGDDVRWEYRAGQAFVWAQLMLQIPKQARAHVDALARAAKPRLDELERLFPKDPEIEALRDRLDPARQLRAEVSAHDATNRWACTTARLVKPLGDWRYHPRLVAVEFALCREGDLKVHCVDIPPRKALPAFVDTPRTVGEARGIATALVADAIRVIEGES